MESNCGRWVIYSRVKLASYRRAGKHWCPWHYERRQRLMGWQWRIVREIEWMASPGDWLYFGVGEVEYRVRRYRDGK